MFRLFKKIINIEFLSVNQTALWLGILTIFSQFLGVLRDRILASSIGPGQLLDIYYASFKIPDLIYSISASLVSASIIIPVIIDLMKVEGKEATKKYLSDMLSTFLLAILILTVTAFITMPWLVKILVPGFTGNAALEVISTSRLMLISPFLLGLSFFASAIVQYLNRFITYGLSPIVYNLGIIFGATFLYKPFGLKGLVYGVLIGSFFHLIIEFPILRKFEFMPSISFNVDWKKVKHSALISFPRSMTLWMNQFMFLALVSIASTIAPGSISIMQFAYAIQSVPLGLIGSSYSIASFPLLVEYYNHGQFEKFCDAVVRPLRHIIVWSVAFSMMFIVLRAHIVRILLGAGKFDWADTRLTSAVLALFMLSVLGQSIVTLLVRGYYATGRTWRPFVHNLISFLLVVAFAFIGMSFFKNNPMYFAFLQKAMRVEGVPGALVIVLPLAFSLGILVNVLILWASFYLRFLRNYKTHITKTLMQTLFASFLMSAVTYHGLQIFGNIFETTTFFGLLYQAAASGLAGLVVWLLCMYGFGNEEILDLLESLNRRFSKK